jgi:acyl-CoA thioester hydrolase
METYRGVVYPSDCDVIGHMNVKNYTGAFDQAMWHLVHAAGYRTIWASDRGEGWVDAEHVTRFQRELTVGSLYRIESRVLKVGTSSLRSFHELYDVDHAEPAATCEMVSVYFDLNVRAPKPIGEVLARGLRSLSETPI